MSNRIVIDATNSTLGRIASYASKHSLLGAHIIIVNCKDAIVLGNKTTTINEYKVARARGSHDLKGPHFPYEPAKLMKRTIRGMLRYKKGRGNDAFKRIICYDGLPKEYEDTEKVSIIKNLNTSKLTLKELSERI